MSLSNPFSLFLTLSKETYQDGHERSHTTGHACPECHRVFDNTTWLRTHRESAHGILDAIRQAEVARKREKDRQYHQRRKSKPRKRSA